MAMGIEAQADTQNDGSAEAQAEVAAEAKAEVNERMQRIRIGLSGLAFVFLLVLIGAAISNWGDTPTNAANQAIANATPAEPNEPLAEIGAAPGESSAANAATDNAQ
ncbi:hypothetical protein [Sphingomonas sp.]|uniref:hypothetical protein n=1 Tax=Sphingomonas sp. TaxID=28214 RepID=UPI00286AF580|nr:hypothetical protein [Sphingomonas sp.]